MPSLLSRLAQAFRNSPPERPGEVQIFAREPDRPQQRSIPPPQQLTAWWNSYGIPPPFKPKEAQEAYGDNVWLYSAINVIASEVARTKFKLMEERNTGEPEEIKKHQALLTLQRPQTTETGKCILTGSQLKFLTTQHILLNGEAFWLMEDRIAGVGGPRSLYPLNPAYVYEKVNKDGEIEKYVYRVNWSGSEHNFAFDPADVIHFKLPDPANWLRGQPPVKSIRYALDTYKEADILNFKRLRNNAVPAGILKTSKALDEGTGKKLLEQWKKLYGGSENSSKIALLPESLEFQETQQNNKDMQFIEGKDKNRDEILANLRVGLEMLGKTEGQTRANADTSVYVFQRFSVLPILEMMADTLTYDFLRSAFKGADRQFFGFKDPVPENMEEKRQNFDLLFRNGALTSNELRKGFGLEELDDEGMDIPYLDMGKTAIDQVDAEPEEGENVAPNEQDDPKAA